VIVGVLVYAWLGDDTKRWLGMEQGFRVPPKQSRLRIATWNMRNFPDAEQDRDRLSRTLRELEADVLAFQEIRDAHALSELVPELTVHVSHHGGRGGQAVALAYDAHIVTLIDGPHEDEHLTLGGRVRPALHAYLRVGKDGPDFHVVVVHLKAKPEGLDDRRRQWSALALLVQRLSATDEDVLVLGDFNVTGGADRNAERELVEAEQVLGATGLARIPTHGGCSAYWDGTRRDRWQEPSLLDLMWTRALAEALHSGSVTTPASHCARHGCQPFGSTDTYPELDFVRGSDHCPVVLDLLHGTDDDTQSLRSTPRDHDGPEQGRIDIR